MILDSGQFTSQLVYGDFFEQFIRPVFYLKTNVEYISGDGLQENPYRIA